MGLLGGIEAGGTKFVCAVGEPGNVSAETRFEWDAENPTFKVSTKLRAIDPASLPNNLITQQVANGVSVRMAVLFDVLGGSETGAGVTS